MTKKLEILIVEDDEKDSDALVTEINENAECLALAGVTKSSSDAYNIIRNRKPHAVILDLELQEGSGDGMELLNKLNSTLVVPKPYIVVNTNSSSKLTREMTKQLGADYGFAKWQSDYSPKRVIEHLILLMPVILGNEQAPLTQSQLEDKMREFLQKEFNKINMKPQNLGYGYLTEAVILAANGVNNKFEKAIADKIGEKENNIKNAMHSIIDSTWLHTDINVLQKHFTAPLEKGQYVPTIHKFIFFYKQKLIKYLNG